MCNACKVLQMHSQCMTHAMYIEEGKFNPCGCEFCNKAILEVTVLNNETMATKLLGWITEL